MVSRSRAEWEGVALHPDPREDLDYEIANLRVVESDGGPPHLLFLPWTEELLSEEAFVIADAGSVVNLLDVR